MSDKFKKMGLAFGFFAAALLLSGCSEIRGYSVKSYQGPLPQHDYTLMRIESGKAQVPQTR